MKAKFNVGDEVTVTIDGEVPTPGKILAVAHRDDKEPRGQQDFCYRIDAVGLDAHRNNAQNALWVNDFELEIT